MARRPNRSGSVYKDEQRKCWIGEVTLDGRRRRVTARTKTDCSAKLARLISEHERGELSADGNATVQQALDAWRKRVLPSRPLAPSSVDLYKWALDMLEAEVGSVRLRRLDVTAVEKALDRLASGSQGRPLSRRSLALVRSTLTQVLDHAMRRKLITSNPARIADLTPDAPRTQRRQALTADQAKVLWNALDDERLGPLFRLQLMTGVRPGEAAGLCWDAVDLDNGTITIRRAVRTEGNRTVLVEDLKTESAFRTLALAAPVQYVLRQQRTVFAEMRLAEAKWNDLNLVFPNVKGGPWDARNRRRALTRICEKAGLPAISPNELRHTAATLLSDRGVPLELIADLLGHTTTRMLDETYRHRVRPAADAAVVVLNDIAQVAKVDAP